MSNPDPDDPPELRNPPRRHPVPEHLLRQPDPDMTTTTTTIDGLHKLDISKDDPSALRILSRSPHPYHRRQSQRRPRLDTTATAPVQHSHLSSTSASASASASSPDDYDGLTTQSASPLGFGSSSGRGRLSRSPHSSESQSQSGSEADDEAYSFIKPLPAPPYRPHKGLMGDGAAADGDSAAVVRRRTWGAGAALGVDSPAGDVGSDSALLTPSVLEDEGRRLAERLKRARARTKKEGDGAVEVEEEDDEVRREREKWLRRRRAELLRRGCEVALLGVIGTIVFAGGARRRVLDLWARGMVSTPQSKKNAHVGLAELSTFVLVYAFLLLLYPVRLLLFPKDRSIPFKSRIRVPAAFDPAPLLYPAAIPIFVSLSLYPQMEHVLLPNIVLGLSALPPRLFPSFARGAGYGVEHWFFSLLPLIVSEHTDMFSKLVPARPYLLKAPHNRIDPEIIASLFPLHQALLPPLYYLTTTSLLPSELQLLSVSLINLLLFSESPQMKILSAILWIGGLLLFILCGPVFRWGVALARIPKWRFRRSGRARPQSKTILETLKEGLRPASQSRTRATSDSDADEDHLSGYHSEDDRRASIVSASSAVQALSGALTSASETFREALLPSRSVLNGTPSSKPRRRNTIQTFPSESNISAPITTARVGRRHRSSRPSYASSFLSLTPAQATLRKWLYALYVYATIALIILIPLRYYIGAYALNGHEPFGWAIGYLLGNQRTVRFQLFSLNLDAWAALPPLSNPPDPSSLPHAEFWRQIVLGGPANTRLALAAWDVTILSAGLATVLLVLPASVAVDTRRKIFHATMVAMLLPTVYVDPHFAALATALVLVVFLLLDLIRASTLPPLARWLGRFLAPFVDGRDLRGPVVVSHVFLLVGCGVPLWLGCSLLPTSSSPSSPNDIPNNHPWTGWDMSPSSPHTSKADPSLLAGVVCVGMGDAAASLVGRRFGRRKWPWLGGKSVEGSLAFAAAVALGLGFARVWGCWGWGRGCGVGGGSEGGGAELVVVWAKTLLAGAVASAMEAVLTGGNDNVVVPVVLWVVVRGLGL